MPELPEVYTIATDLTPLLPGRTITQAVFVGQLGEELRRKARVDLDLVLTNKKITGLKRVAKQLVIELSSGENIVFHLKVTGRLLLRRSSDSDDEATRLTLKLDNGQELRFADRNGMADAYLLSLSELDRLKKSYGPEVINGSLTPKEFLEIVHSSPEPTIKQTLLNQKVISGIGNIYADEALLLAKLHPRFPPKQLSQEETARLLAAARQVLEEGIRDRGTTIDSYLDPFGNPGKHQDNLRVYGRTGKPCPQCGTSIEYSEVGGRRTYLCPRCQVLPQMSLF